MLIVKPEELVSLAAFICTRNKERLRIRLTEVLLGIYRKIFFGFRFEIAPLFQYVLKATPVLLTFWKQFTLWIMIFDSFHFLNFSYFNNPFKSLYQTLFWTSLQTFELAVERQAPHRRFEVPTPEVNNWKTEHLFENWFLKLKKFRKFNPSPTMICKKSASTEHWGRQVAWPWNSDKGQLKWRQTTQRWVKTARATKNTLLLLLLQYIVRVTTGFEIQTMREIRTTPPPPQRESRDSFSFFPFWRTCLTVTRY